MASDRTLVIESITFDGTTYNTGNGGPMDVSLGDESLLVKDRVADDLFPTFGAVVQRDVILSIVMRDAWARKAIGTKGTVVITLSDYTVTYTVTLANMQLESIRSSQTKDVPGTAEWTLHHIGTDGQTSPVVVT